LACAVTVVGVPVIAPVVELRLRPAGSAGLTLYVVTVPVMVGVSLTIAWPMVAEIVVCG
jgi:hypothetical protein